MNLIFCIFLLVLVETKSFSSEEFILGQKRFEMIAEEIKQEELNQQKLILEKKIREEEAQLRKEKEKELIRLKEKEKLKQAALKKRKEKEAKLKADRLKEKRTKEELKKRAKLEKLKAKADMKLEKRKKRQEKKEKVKAMELLRKKRREMNESILEVAFVNNGNKNYDKKLENITNTAQKRISFIEGEEKELKKIDKYKIKGKSNSEVIEKKKLINENYKFFLGMINQKKETLNDVKKENIKHELQLQKLDEMSKVLHRYNE